MFIRFFLASLFFVSSCGGSYFFSSKKKIVLLSNDDFNHPSGIHEFFAGAKLLKKSLENSSIKGKVLIEHIHNWSGDITPLEDASVIVHYYKGNKWHLLNENAAVIDELVEKGVGQVFIHYAVDPEKKIDHKMKEWIGGVYKDKFSKNPIWTLLSKL